MNSSVRCFRIILFYIFCWSLLTAADENKAALYPPPKTNTSQNASDQQPAPQSQDPEKSPENEGGTLHGSNPSPPSIHKKYLAEPSVNVEGTFKDNKNIEEGIFKSTQVLIEATSQNSGLANEISSGPPVLVTLTDVASAELQERAAAIPPSPSQPEDRLASNQSTDSNPSASSNESTQTDPPPPNANLTEEIPSFSEWTQKRLEEAEKRREPSNASAQPQNANNGKQSGSGAKLRWKNYASLDCGAKVVASNPEAVSPYAVLSPSRDEYKLNTCTSRIWFIVELCEAIQAKKIDLANFELFSSSPKDFTVSVSDRFPTREWSIVGQFTAKDERDVQSFDLYPHLFGKFVKVEIKTHYGAEHFCPISLFRVYGTSEFEVLQKEDAVHGGDRLEDDDDDDESLDVDTGDSSKNLFSSATDAVISMVKKAAQVLGNNKGRNESQSGLGNVTKTKYTPLVNSCTSPSHLVVCDNCTDLLFGQVYQLLSCKSNQIRNLVTIPLIRKALINSNLCKSYGFDFRRIASDFTVNSPSSCVESFFPRHYLGAMCNSLAIAENKVVLNISNNQYLNTTEAVEVRDDLKIAQIETSEPLVLLSQVTKNVDQVTDALTNIEITSSIETSTDLEHTSEIIKPTKTMTSEVILHESTESPPLTSIEVLPVDEIAEPSELEDSPPPEVINVETETLPPPPPPIPTESVENLDFENIISDLKEVPNNTPQVQKESVFLRLSNRIKALERNMSLSGQYLEELSKRYKKQVEEMQKLLEKTVSNMNEEIKKKDERNKILQEDLHTLQCTVDSLVAETRGWFLIVYCVVTSTVVTVLICKFCLRVDGNGATIVNDAKESIVEVKRRQSIDVVVHGAPTKKKRRPSDQALKIVRSSMMTSSENGGVGDGAALRTKEKKRKKRKEKLLRRSSSINTLNEETRFEPAGSSSKIWSGEDWIENGRVEDVPFALEESEHSTLETLNLPFKTNGTPPVEVPSYVNTALKSRKDRESLQEQGFKFNKSVAVPSRRAVSADESARSQPSPPINGNGEINFTEESTTTNAPTKKEKRSFKKMLKKVF